jgi:hypothetical protein
MTKSVLRQTIIFFAIVATTLIINEAMRFAMAAAPASSIEYLVVPVKLPFGERGAREYEALLNDMTAQGWTYDHGLTGFTVFKR